MTKSILLPAAVLFVLFSTSPVALALIGKQVECVAWTHDQSDGGAVAYAPLRQADFDPEYYQAEIGNYSFGADYSMLAQSAVGLIVFDNKTKRFTESTPGFRQVGASKVHDMDLKYYDRLPDDRTVVAGLQCSYSDALQ